MSRYRDDQEAARHRLESLEEKLLAQDAELERHKNEIAERDREIIRLAKELRSAGTARILAPRRNSGARFMVAGAMSAAIVAGMLGFLSVHHASVAPSVTFAELPPPTMPLAAPRLDTAAPRHEVEASPPASTIDKVYADAAKREAELYERNKTDALKLKVWAGKASIDEVRALVARCMREGDQECADRASGILNQIRPNEPL